MILVYFTPPSLSISNQLSKCADFLKCLAFSPTNYPLSGWVCCNGFMTLLGTIRLDLLDSGLSTSLRSSVQPPLCPCHCPRRPFSVQGSFPAGNTSLTGTRPISHIILLLPACTTERLVVFSTNHAAFCLIYWFI